MRSSRRIRVREKRLRNRTIRVLLATIALVSVLVIIGPSILSRFSLLLNVDGQFEVNKGGQKSQFLFPPILDPQPTATNSATINIHGEGQPETTVVVRRNGFKVGKAPVNNDGIFTVGPLKLTEGENIFTATIVTADQESQESNSVKIFYKTEPPVLTITAPEPDSVFTGEERQVRIEGLTEADAQVTINDRIVPVAGDGIFSYNLKLSEGENRITVKARDVAGNETVSELTLSYQP